MKEILESLKFVHDCIHFAALNRCISEGEEKYGEQEEN